MLGAAEILIILYHDPKWQLHSQERTCDTNIKNVYGNPSRPRTVRSPFSLSMNMLPYIASTILEKRENLKFFAMLLMDTATH